MSEQARTGDIHVGANLYVRPMHLDPNFSEDVKIPQKQDLNSRHSEQMPAGVMSAVYDTTSRSDQSLHGIISAGPDENYGIVRLQRERGREILDARMVVKIGDGRLRGQIVGFLDRDSRVIVTSQGKDGKVVDFIVNQGYRAGRVGIQNRGDHLRLGFIKPEPKRFSRASIIAGLKRAIWGEERLKGPSPIVNNLGWTVDPEVVSDAWEQHEQQLAARNSREW